MSRDRKKPTYGCRISVILKFALAAERLEKHVLQHVGWFDGSPQLRWKFAGNVRKKLARIGVEYLLHRQRSLCLGACY
jgi:hypothetical protein